MKYVNNLVQLLGVVPFQYSLNVIALFVVMVTGSLSTSVLWYFECISFAKKETKCTI